MRAQRHLPRLAACVLFGLAGRAHGDGRPASTPAPEAAAPAKLTGTWDDKLPPGAVARLGTNRLRHNRSIHSLSYSVDGKTLISGGYDETIRFWDAATGRPLRVLTGLRNLRTFALSPTGRTLAIPLRSANGLTIRLLDLADGAERTCDRGGAVPMPRVFADPVAFAPDEKSVAAADDFGTVSVIDVATGKRTGLGKHNDPIVYMLAFAPGGTMLASCAGDGVRLWDLSKGKKHRALQAPVPHIFSMAFTPDGKRLIASGNPVVPNLPGPDAATGAVWVWDVDSGEQPRSLPIPRANESVGYSAVSQDGRVLAVQAGHRLVLWDLKADRLIRSIPVGDGRTAYVLGLSLSPDGRLVAFGFGSVGRVYETSSGRPVWPDPDDADGAVTELAFSSDGRLLAALDEANGLRVWDARNRRPVHRFPASPGQRLAVAFVPGSNLLAVLFGDGGVCLWDPATGRERPLSVPPRDRARASRLAVSPDGHYLVSGNWTDGPEGGPRFLRVWDLLSGIGPQELKIEPALLGWFTAVRFAPDGATLMATADEKWYRWRLQNGRFQGAEVLSRQIGFAPTTLGPDGTLAGANFEGNGLKLWAAGADRVRKQLDGPPGFGRVLAFSADGRYLASAGGLLTGDARDCSVRVYELTEWQEVFRWEAPAGTAACSAAFSPGGRYLLTGMADSTVLAWDLFPAGGGERLDPARLWESLGSDDRRRAQPALGRLVALGDRGVAFVAERVRPLHPPDPARLARLIADLDSRSFATRERASREIAALSETAWPALERARDMATSPEVRQRTEALLKNRREGGPLPPTMLAADRAVEALERIGTRRAKEALRSLASGLPGAHLTREAQAALDRLEKRAPAAR